MILITEWFEKAIVYIGARVCEKLRLSKVIYFQRRDQFHDREEHEATHGTYCARKMMAVHPCTYKAQVRVGTTWTSWTLKAFPLIVTRDYFRCWRRSADYCKVWVRRNITMTNPTHDYRSPVRPTRSLEGRVAIVTGAGSRAEGIGNGRAASILLAEAGARVVCLDLNAEWAQVTVSMITKEFGKDKAIALKVDVTQEDECKCAVETTLKKFSRLDILVNNVGVGGPVGTAVDVDPTQWAKGLEINVTSMVLMTKFAVPAMERNERHPISGRGSIINIASVAGLMGGTPILLYPTSKGAVVNMTRAMAAHHAPSGIRVNCVCPGKFPRIYLLDKS